MALALAGGVVLPTIRNWRRQRAFDRKFNPYTASRPIVDPEGFFGREDLLSNILNTVHTNHVMIHGERRIGKTSLLHQIQRRLSQLDDPDYRLIPLYVDLEIVERNEFSTHSRKIFFWKVFLLSGRWSRSSVLRSGDRHTSYRLYQSRLQCRPSFDHQCDAIADHQGSSSRSVIG